MLELAQFREVQAFAQFGSDLDAATQQQLLRGSILTELLKQGQFVPMKTEDIVVVLFAGVKGYLDKFAIKEVKNFEVKWLKFVQDNHKDLLSAINETKMLSPENEEKLHSAMADFLSQNEFTPK